MASVSVKSSIMTSTKYDLQTAVNNLNVHIICFEGKVFGALPFPGALPGSKLLFEIHRLPKRMWFSRDLQWTFNITE